MLKFCYFAGCCVVDLWVVTVVVLCRVCFCFVVFLSVTTPKAKMCYFDVKSFPFTFCCWHVVVTSSAATAVLP